MNPTSRRPSNDFPARTHAAALGVELRSPLSQIELAASQLVREALTPTAQRQTQQIFAAVAQIDDLVERMLRVLVPPKRLHVNDRDLGAVVSELRRRFAPSLSACGVEWTQADDSGQGVRGNPEQVRKLMTELLRLALSHCGRGGRFDVRLSDCDTSLEIALACRPESQNTGAHSGPLQRDFERAEVAIFEAGGVLSLDASASESELRVVIPRDVHADPTDSHHIEEEPCLAY